MQTTSKIIVILVVLIVVVAGGLMFFVFKREDTSSPAFNQPYPRRQVFPFHGDRQVPSETNINGLRTSTTTDADSTDKNQDISIDTTRTKSTDTNKSTDTQDETDQERLDGEIDVSEIEEKLKDMEESLQTDLGSIEGFDLDSSELSF